MTEAEDFKWMRTGDVAALVRSGTGGTVVIVPGAMSDAKGWLPFATALDTAMSIAIVNRRGRAPSADLPVNSTVADEVADMRAMLSRLEGPFVLVGWSYGGLLAIEAGVGTAGITSIILYEPVCGPLVPTTIEPIRRSVAAGDLDHAVELVITKVSGAPNDQVAALRETPAWAYLKRPVALFVDDAHDLHPKTLTALKRLVELVTEGGGQLAVILVGHPKLRNDLKRPQMEEIGDRTTVFEFGGLRDRQRDYIDWALRAALSPGVEPKDVLTEDAAVLLAAKLKTPLQIGRHLVRTFEAGFSASVKPVDAAIVDGVLSRQIDDLEPQLTRHGYDAKSLAE